MSYSSSSPPQNGSGCNTGLQNDEPLRKVADPDASALLTLTTATSSESVGAGRDFLDVESDKVNLDESGRNCKEGNQNFIIEETKAPILKRPLLRWNLSEKTTNSKAIDGNEDTLASEKHVLLQENITPRERRKDQKDESLPNDDYDDDETNRLNRLLARARSTSSSDGDFHNSRHRRQDSQGWVDFAADDWLEMTLGRRIALTLKKHEWYYPKEKEHFYRIAPYSHERAAMRASIEAASNEAYPFTVADLGHPKLDKAWEYFEHFTLARYLVDENIGREDTARENTIDTAADKSNNKERAAKRNYDRAKPGEQEYPTRLYSVFGTPHQELGDWGLGIGIYFTTLRWLTVIMFLAACLSLPNIIYYAGSEYSQNQPGVPLHLKGSAICTDRSWVVCLDCQWDDFPHNRIASAIPAGSDALGSNSTTHFVLRNNCDGATVTSGMINLGVLLVVVVGVLLMNLVVIRAEVAFDEDEQTAQDYSIVVKNPPPGANDPNVWKDYFYENFDRAHVTVCTIGVANDLLVRNLVSRRENLRLIEMKVPPGTPLDTLTLARLASQEERSRGWWGRMKAHFSPGISECLAKVVVSTVKIQGLAQQDHEVSNVFITFETESAQRRVLAALSVGKHAAKHNIKSALKDQRHLFQGRVLHVVEAEEPSAIRWQDLNESSANRWKQQAYTFIATAVAIVVISLIVRAINNVDVRLSAAVIACFNISFPAYANFLTSFESHASESGKQRSMYYKVALQRWINTSVIVTIIFDFTRILENSQGLVQQVFTLFFAEIVSNTVLQLLDTSGHFKRHYLAPRANNQWSMNLLMSGTPFDLSERYTNMTKVLLLSVWYNAIFPTSLFLCSLALCVNYFSDKFSLMRTWKPAPMLGPRIATFSRKYFFSAALVSMALLSAYYWSGFPFDNICEKENNRADDISYVGEWDLKIKGSGDRDTVSVGESDATYVFCRQDFLRYYDNQRAFPFVPENQLEGLEWMSSDQEFVTRIWGIVSVVVIGVVLIRLASYWFADFKAYFKGDYDPCGKDQKIPFSEVKEISGYIPQVYSPVYPHPLLATSIDRIGTQLLDFEDHERDYSFYDLTLDARFLLRGKNIAEHVMFSKVVHWPPNDETQLTPRLEHRFSEI